MNSKIGARSLEDVIEDMKSCYQIPNKQTVWEHGESVRENLLKIYDFCSEGKDLPIHWPIPDWLNSHKKSIRQVLYSKELLGRYALFHDLGKPYCSEKDPDGQVHFVDHEKVSAKFWNNLFPNEDLIYKLILNDLKIHKLKATEVEEFCLDKRLAVNLLLSGLAAIYSNQELFGGLESTSFKIKFKTIKQRGKQIMKICFK